MNLFVGFVGWIHGLKRQRFQVQAGFFRQTKNQIQVLDSLTGGTFGEVVDGTDDEGFVSVF